MSSEPHSVIELFFDDDTEERLRCIWARFKDAGVSDFMIANKARPHVTLAAAASFPAEPITPGLKALAEGQRELEVDLSFCGVWHRAGCIFIGLTTTYQLLNLHDRLLRFPLAGTASRSV